MLKEYIADATKNAEEALSKAQQLTEQLGVKIQTKVIRDVVSATTVTKIAESSKTDLIVMGSHGRKGFQKLFLGSFAQDVLGQTQIPVLIVKQ